MTYPWLGKQYFDPEIADVEMVHGNTVPVIRRKRSKNDENDAGKDNENDEDYDDYTYDDYVEEAKKREQKYKKVAGSEGPPSDEEITSRESENKAQHPNAEIEKYLYLINEYKQKHTPGFLQQKPPQKKEISQDENLDSANNAADVEGENIDNYLQTKHGKRLSFLDKRYHNKQKMRGRQIENGPDERLLAARLHGGRHHGLDPSLMAHMMHRGRGESFGPGSSRVHEGSAARRHRRQSARPVQLAGQ